MKFVPTDLPGVMIIEPVVFRDDRGFFFENYHKKRFVEAGITLPFVQDNISRSTKGTLRGLHLQLRQPQGKLIRAIAGEIFDVAVDVRVGSPTFKKWVSVRLSADNFKMIYVPPGFAHGFYTLSDVADVGYKCTDFYDGPGEGGIAWNDPEIGIDWPNMSPLLSAKDQKWPKIKDAIEQLSGYPAYRT